MFAIKHFTVVSLLAANCILAPLAQAQFFPPVLIDFRAPDTGITQTAPNSGHTGIDSYAFPRVHGGSPLTVFTWDNNLGQVFLSAKVGTVGAVWPGMIVPPNDPNGILSDPDVVYSVGQDGRLYADLVYIETVGTTSRTYYAVYQTMLGGPNSVTLDPTPYYGPIPLGAAGLIHSNPNIDANDSGEVGIVWQESVTEPGTVTTSFPNHAQTSPLTMDFADSYMIRSKIDGPISCSSTRGDLITTIDNSNPPTSLYNLSIHPDVAMSDHGVMSVCFINNYAYTITEPATGLSSPATYYPARTRVKKGTRLVVNQYTDICNPGFLAFEHKEWTDGVSEDATPRIAAPNNPNFDPNDVEVVLDWEDYACPEKVGPVVYREIHNFGKSNGAFRPGFAVVSPPYVPGKTTTPTRLPVVAYFAEQDDPGINAYVIDWFAQANSSTNEYFPNGDDIDIWSRTFKKGMPLYGSSAYSRINYNAKGHQFAPSVAARYLEADVLSAHIFADSYFPQISHKLLTAIQPGSGSVYRQSGHNTIPSKSSSAPSIQAFPNPSSATVDFSLHLKTDEVVQQLTVMDLTGRVVDKIVVPANQAAEQVVSWLPKTTVPNGSYIVKLVTNLHTENITINRLR